MAVQKFQSNFGVELPSWITWRLTFDGQHFFADIANQTTNGGVSIRHFLNDLHNGKLAELSLDDEGDFFELIAKPMPELDGKIVNVSVREARGGRTAEFTLKTKDFVEEITRSIKQFKDYFEKTPFYEYSILDGDD